MTETTTPPREIDSPHGPRRRTARAGLALLCAAILAACGGGGGGGDGGGGGADTGHVIGGRVDGLTGTGLVLRNNGAESLSVPAAGQFRFVETVARGGAYNVTVAAQPGGQACTVAQGSGVANGPVGDVVVTCQAFVPPPPPPDTLRVGGSVAGLAGSGLVLRNNGADDLAVADNGAFSFATRLAGGAAYAVTVATQPSGQQCSVAAGSGTVADADVTSVAVSCVDTAPPPPPPQSYTVGGSISGLVGAGMVLQNNGGDSITVAAESTRFTFPAPVVSGGAYDVRVAVQPLDNDCTVAQGAGTVGAGNVTNVQISCGPVAPMSLIGSTPAQGATEVSRDVVPALTFSTALDPVTVVDKRSTSLSLSDALGVDAFVPDQPGAQGSVLTMTPRQRLLPVARYTANVSRGVRGTRGEQLESEFGLSFTTADAGWGSPAVALASGELVARNAGEGSMRMATASNRLGDAVVVWLSTGGEGNAFRVMARFHRAGSGQWGDAVELRAIPDSIDFVAPALTAAVDDNGDVVVAWLQRGTAGVQVMARYRAAASGAWGAVSVVGTGAAGSGPAVAAVGNGAVRLAWIGDDLITLHVANGRMADDSAWQAPRLVATANASWFINRAPSIVALPKRAAMVVWEEDLGATQRGLVRALRLDDAGQAAEVRPTDLATSTGPMPSRPSVAVQVVDNWVASPVFHVHVAWRLQGTNEDRILARRWNSAARTWDATPMTVAALPHSDHRIGYPVVVAPSGRWNVTRAAQVIWREAGNAGEATVRVRAAAVPPQGTPGAPVVVATMQGQYQAAAEVVDAAPPAATVDMAGNVLVLHGRPAYARVGSRSVVSHQPQALRWQALSGTWSAGALEAEPSWDAFDRPRLIGASDTGVAWAIWRFEDLAESRSIQARRFD